MMRNYITGLRPGGVVRVDTDENQRGGSTKNFCHVGPNVIVNYRALEEFHFQRMTPIQFDFAPVTGAVAYVDRSFLRRGSQGWQRDLGVIIPVHEHETWNQSTVVEALVDCLTFLTGDNWWFEFIPRTNLDEWLQHQQFLNLRTFQPSAVLPFSGGMDSWAVAQMIRLNDPSANLLLAQIQNPSASILFDNDKSYNNSIKNIQSIRLPFKLRGIKKKEHTYRTRSFVFYGAAALASILSGYNQVVITENGQGSLGPSLLPYAHEWPLRGAHPGFTTRLRRPIRALFDVDIKFDHHSLWKTKGQILKLIEKKSSIHNWEMTYSCTRYRPKLPITSPRRDCGICGNCLLTRVSLRAAGIEPPVGRYIWDDLKAKELSGALQSCAKRATNETDTAYAIHAIKDLASLASFASNLSKEWSRLTAEELSNDLNIDIDDLQVRIDGLVTQHAREWREFVTALPADAWVRNVAEFWGVVE